MNGSVRMGQVLGVPLRIHWTVPLLVVLFGYGLGSQTLPAWVPERSDTTYTFAGLAGALLLLGSLLAHEAAHAFTARRKGIPVQGITLWALGGMTEMGKPRAAGAAFLVAVSGPLTSLVAGAAALGAGVGLDALSGWAVPSAVLVWLGWVNFVLGVFNLLPAAPLDGGGGAGGDVVAYRRPGTGRTSSRTQRAGPRHRADRPWLDLRSARRPERSVADGPRFLRRDRRECGTPGCRAGPSPARRASGRCHVESRGDLP